jgi:hypothetical protein
MGRLAQLMRSDVERCDKVISVWEAEAARRCLGEGSWDGKMQHQSDVHESNLRENHEIDGESTPNIGGDGHRTLTLSRQGKIGSTKC